MLLKFIHANAAFSTVGEGKLVKLAPDPEKVVAVQVPVTVKPPDVVSAFLELL